MNELAWSHIVRLQGRTLRTTNGNPFLVATVTATTVTVIPESTGKRRTIPRAEIEKGHQLIATASVLTPSRVRQAGASEANPAYVVAILRTIADPFGASGETQDDLLTLAREAATGAYAPYSGCRVGAAVVAEDGRVFAGCNVENASYGLSICAERVAIFTAVAAGARTITALAVTASAGEPPTARVFTPCGACRQVMAEFMRPEAPITVDGAGTFTLGELLPRAFQL